MPSSKIEKIHIGLPNSVEMLLGEPLYQGDLKIALIEGHYSKSIEKTPLKKTKYGGRATETIERRWVKWGNKNLGYNEATTLQEIHNSEGSFIITRMIALKLYDENVVVAGVPTTVQNVARHDFKKWPFKPNIFQMILDRMPSHPLYEKLKREKKKWEKKGGSRETLKRLRDTWLINRPEEKLPLNVYRLWYGTGAMILPETIGDFKGRELGTDYEL